MCHEPPLMELNNAHYRIFIPNITYQTYISYCCTVTESAQRKVVHINGTQTEAAVLCVFWENVKTPGNRR